MFAAMLAVLGILVMGIITMIKGKEFREKHGNRLMRARVILQGVAIGLVALAYLSNHAG